MTLVLGMVIVAKTTVRVANERRPRANIVDPGAEDVIPMAARWNM